MEGFCEKRERENGRNGYIELCRFIFAFCIVSHHFMLLPTGPEHVPLIGGYIGTDFFFILSGFFLYAAAREDTDGKTTVEVVCKKFKKIFPYFLVSWLIAFAVNTVKTQPGVFRGFYNLLAGIPQLFLLTMTGIANGQSAPNAYVGTSWYLSALMVGMIAVYPLMRRYRETFVAAFAPLIAVFCYGYFMVVNGNIGVVNQFTFCKLGVFRAIAGLCLGGFCYWIAQKLKGMRLTKIGQTMASSLQIALIFLSLLLMEFYRGHNDSLQIGIFVCLIVISMGFDTAVNRFFAGPVTAFLGRFSMAIFLSQSVTYMYGVLPYPEDWRLCYAVHYGYVLCASLLVYYSVALLRRAALWEKIKELLFANGKQQG